MRKILISLLLIIINSIGFSQDYPILHKDSVGNEVVTFTIEQVQIIDNKLELLELLESYNITASNIDSLHVHIIKSKDSIIKYQYLQLEDYKALNENNERMLENRQITIDNYILKEKLLTREIYNKDIEINLHLKEINRLKKNNLIIGSSGGLVVVGGIILMLLIK